MSGKKYKTGRPMPERGSEPPKINDFSRRAIRHEVMREGLTHWLTLYPTAVGIPLGLAALLFNLPVLYFGMIGTLTISLASAIINIFFRDDAIASRYLARLSQKLKEEEKRTLDSLGDELLACRKNNIIGQEYADQAIEQFKRLQQKYMNVHTVLSKKLSRGELAYGRFVGASEQVYLSGLDNLKHVAAVLQSLGSIDPEYIASRLKHLTKNGSGSRANQKEMETLQRRLKLKDEQLDKINLLLTSNEEAMTALEETTAAIAAMKTGGKFTDAEYESAIAQLQEIAGKAYLYNRQ